jgi:surfactin synthase thioesterase subunit
MVERAALDGWRDHTAAEFQLHLLDDGHMFLQTKRRRLLEIIASALAAGDPGVAGAAAGRTIDV